MTTLAVFLEARLAEDEVVARKAAEANAPPRGYRPSSDTLWTTTYMVDRLGPRGSVEATPARVLAEVAAKRAIVGIYSWIQFGEGPDGEMVPLGGDGPETYWDALRALASVYAAHPDYRAAEWA